MNQIKDKYYEIKDDFRVKITRLGLAFDEDIFSDTLIKCNEKLKETNCDGKSMINYFWCAFKTNTLRDLNYSRNHTTDKIPEIPFECDDNGEIFELISKSIIEKFGEESYELFALHANGMSYEELYKITERKHIKYLFRRIREYIRKKYGKKIAVG